jgi:hypothetical protein
MDETRLPTLEVEERISAPNLLEQMTPFRLIESLASPTAGYTPDPPARS